jgi:hypothetical protein
MRIIGNGACSSHRSEYLSILFGRANSMQVVEESMSYYSGQKEHEQIRIKDTSFFLLDSDTVQSKFYS